MKKMLLLLTAATLSFATVQAQTTPPAADGTTHPRHGQGMGHGQARFTPEQRADMQTRRLTKQLTLSADQQTKVRSIFLTQATEMDKLRTTTSPSPDRQARAQQLRDLRARTDEQLKGALTSEQFTKYTQIREERMEDRAEKRAETKKAGKAKEKAS